MLQVAALLVEIAAIAVALWLLQDNPTADDGHGGQRLCAAPYDTVFLGNDNVSGGEHPPDIKTSAARCRHAGELRFGIAIGTAAVGIAFAVGTILVVSRRPRASGLVV